MQQLLEQQAQGGGHAVGQEHLQQLEQQAQQLEELFKQLSVLQQEQLSALQEALQRQAGAQSQPQVLQRVAAAAVVSVQLAWVPLAAPAIMAGILIMVSIPLFAEVFPAPARDPEPPG